MKFQKKPIATAVSLALISMAVSVNVYAQATPPANTTNTEAAAVDAKKAEDAKKAAAKKTEQIDTVVVTGIRASLQKSIDTKKEADTNVEVVSAEDIGKLPDKNIADALSRLTGVNVQYGGALALDEAERVAIRGTSPNLNLTTINGHALSSGDWHVGDQAGSGRSVGFGLMPSQLIGKAIVYKTGRADITEGGIAGTFDIQTRRPLDDFKQNLTGEISLGAVHAELAKKTDPQASGLIAWQNDSKNLGVMLQAFREDRHLRRDGQETFGFNFISAAAANNAGNPALAGLRLPGSLNSALFEGKREREGGFIGVQWKPTNNIDLNVSGFRAELRADNYNSSAFALPNTLISNGWIIKNPIVEGDVLVGATLERPANAAASQRVIGLQFDHNLRQGAKSLSDFIDFDGKFNISDNLTLKTRIGITKGSGVTNSQPSLTFGLINPNLTYRINTGRPTDYTVLNANGTPIDTGNINNYVQLSNTGASVRSTDEEKYFHFDGEYKLGNGIFTNIKFGARNAKHERNYEVIAPRYNAIDNADGSPVTPSPFISVTGGLLVTNVVNNNIPVPATRYPANWGSGLDANFPRNLFRFNPDQLQNFANQFINWDPIKNKQWNSGYTVEETNNAAYVMSEFELDKVTGNIGLRAVETKVRSVSYQALPSGTATGQCVPLQPCSIPGAITTSRIATYIPQVVETSHTAYLPSLNIRWEIASDLIARFALTKTLGRPNYNELAGAVSVNNTLLTGTSGNPNLKPTTATNIDANVAYYFDRRAYVSGGLFHQELKDYVKPGLSRVEFFNTATGLNAIYDVTSRIAAQAKLSGAEVAAETPIGNTGFGVLANLTYIEAKDSDNQPVLGTSRITYNLQGYYEDDKFSARLAWNYRSNYAIGFVNNATNTATIGTHRYKGEGGLSTSISYKFTPNLSVTADGNNLLNPVRSTYYITENAPGYWHQNGRQYFVTLRAKF
jgi:iron complex outermembrane recepter protein